MAETPKVPSPDATVPLARWIARVMLAVILAEGVWGFLVSLTRNLIVPLLAQQMGADPKSPLYLGKGEINLGAIFASVLELCFAGIAAAMLYAWANRGVKVARVKTVTVRKVATPPSGRDLSITPPVAPPITPPQTVVSPPAPAPQVSQAATVRPQTPVAPQAKAAPAPMAAPEKPSKPKAKPVYYNIVGEPINPTEDD